MAAFDTVLFVNRDKLDFHFGGKVLTLTFTPTTVRDIEVLNSEAFRAELTAFMDKNGISFGTCAILLSDSVCFISEVIPKTQDIEDSLSAFLATLPFENPVARILGDKIIGTNKDLYQLIVDVVGQRGGRVKMISPIFLSKEMFGKKKLDDAVLKFVSDNEDTLFKATFVYDAPMPVVVAEQPATPRKRNRRELILIGLFAALLVGLLVWLLTRLL